MPLYIIVALFQVYKLQMQSGFLISYSNHPNNNFPLQSMFYGITVSIYGIHEDVGVAYKLIVLK